MTVAKLWRAAPCWERAVYLAAGTMFALAFLVTLLPEHFDVYWVMVGTHSLSVYDIDTLLLVLSYPFLVATCWLAMPRWSPRGGRIFRQLWSVRMLLVGVSVLFALVGWFTVVDLVTPPGQFPPDPPTFAAVLGIASGCLVTIGMVLAAPEGILRMSSKKDR